MAATTPGAPRLDGRSTTRDHQARPAPDLVDRNFAVSGRDQLWVADITYIPTWAGFLYLAVVVDAWSRRHSALGYLSPADFEAKRKAA